MKAATGTTVDVRAYSGDLKDVLRDVLADALQTDGLNGVTAAYNAELALWKEVRRLRGDGMVDTARRIEVVARALHAIVPDAF